MQIVFQMRYSYFGFSAWQSAASRDPGQLFDPGRLAQRAYFAEHLALKSLQDQVDEDFRLVVVSSDQMPAAEQKRLTEMCNDMLGEDRVDVLFRPYGRVHKWFRRYMASSVRAKHAMQVVLDDDDALANDFTEVMRKEGHFALSQFEGPDDYVFLSQPRGMSAVFGADGVTMMHRYSEYTNLGLALLGPRVQALTPFGTAHKRIARRHPTRLISRLKPAYIRAVHGLNDSQAQVSDILMSQAEIERAQALFPLLPHLLTDKSRPAAAA